MKNCVIIPARYGSTRFEGKPLKDATGWPLIRHVYEQVKKAKTVDHIVVATDDERIKRAVEDFGGQAIMTSDQHPSGTDRLAETVSKLSDPYDIIVNVQGDEPEIEPALIDQIIRLHQKSGAFMSTMVCPFPKNKLSGHGSPLDPSCVKAILGQPIEGIDQGFFALYFTRALAPYPRTTSGAIENSAHYYMHIGMYAYSPEALQAYVKMPQSFLEKTESLEQLRILENGHSIAAQVIDAATPGIDTPEDYAAFIQRWKEQQL